MTITLYGIKNCSTMKKAFDKLHEMGITYDFHDYKKQPINEKKIQTWSKDLGLETVLNKKGMTWRNLSDEQKHCVLTSEKNAIMLMAQNPSMIKRPIIEIKQNEKIAYLVGFDEGKYEKMFGKSP